MPELKSLLEKVIGIVREADAAVMEIYNSGDFEVEMKEDDAQPGYISPLTKADKLANQIIEAGLKRISDYPIMSEEGSHDITSWPGASRLDAVQGSKEERVSRTGSTVSERQTPADTAMRQEPGRAAGSASRQGQAVRRPGRFWCVDPIDGTKEFIKRNGEFTVNVGLVENGEPILGVVSAPAQSVIYYGAKGYGAFRQTGREKVRKIAAKFDDEVPVVAVSRSHLNQETEDFLKKLGNYELLKSGSSIKFCLVADGTAALYPRLGESHLWDTAAADAILRAAGGTIAATTTSKPLVYNPTGLINPNFIVTSGNYKL